MTEARRKSVSKLGTPPGLEQGAPSATSRRLFERAVRVMPGGNTRTTLFVSPFAPYAARGEGYEIIDVDGRRLVDLAANYSALVHGHSHPDIVGAAMSALEDGSCFGLPTASEVELAEHLTARSPALESVRFTNSGTEAVMMAIRAARAFTGRGGVLRFAGCYHGLYDSVLAEDAAGVPASLGRELVTVPFGDEEALVEAVEARGSDLACVIIDLMPNRAGLHPADPAFVRLVRDQSTAVGALMVVDEVITFRLDLAGLHSLYGINPDVVTLGKVIGGGFAVGAFGGRADVMARFDPREPARLSHGGTFNANPVTTRAGLRALELLDAESIERINALGDRLRQRLREIGYEASGRGSLLRLHWHDQDELWWRAYRAGVLLAANGLACISTPMNEGTVELLVERFAGLMD